MWAGRCADPCAALGSLSTLLSLGNALRHVVVILDKRHQRGGLALSIAHAPGLGVIDLRRKLSGAQPLVGRPAAPNGRVIAATAVRAPVAAAGIVALIAGLPIMSVGLFALFAAADYFDGAEARKHGSDSASRRILDVVIDRVSIHAASLTCVAVLGVPLQLALLLATRDIAQAAYSLWRLSASRVVFVGPRWHMAYGLAFLIWGSYTMVEGVVSPVLTLGLGLVSAATLLDFMVRTSRILATTTSTE